MTDHQSAPEAVESAQIEALWQTIKRAVEMIDNLKYAAHEHEDSFDAMQRNYRKELRAALARQAPGERK